MKEKRTVRIFTLVIEVHTKERRTSTLCWQEAQFSCHGSHYLMVRMIGILLLLWLLWKSTVLLVCLWLFGHDLRCRLQECKTLLFLPKECLECVLSFYNGYFFVYQKRSIRGDTLCLVERWSVVGELFLEEKLSQRPAPKTAWEVSCALIRYKILTVHGSCWSTRRTISWPLSLLLIINRLSVLLLGVLVTWLNHPGKGSISKQFY